MSWWLAHGTFKWTFDWKATSKLKATSTYMSLKTQELCWQGLELLTGSTKWTGLGRETRQKAVPGPPG